MRVSHLTAPICLLARARLALARYDGSHPGSLVGFADRDRSSSSGHSACGSPRRRRYGAALLAAGDRRRVRFSSSCRTSRSTTTRRSLLQLGRGFDQDSYTLFGLLVQSRRLGRPRAGRDVVVGLVLLAATWRYRSFTLAIAAALTLSPIVWLDYFALAALPLALARPRLSWIWFLPLATWGLSGAGLGIGDVRTDLRVLVVFCVVLAVAFRGEPRDAGEVRPAT